MSSSPRYHCGLFRRLPLASSFGLVIAMLMLAAVPVYPQSPPGGWGGGGWRGHGEMRGRGQDRARFPTSEEIDGPPAPAALQQIVGLGNEQTQQYTHDYDEHMKITRPARDSLRVGIRTARSEFESGDPEAARSEGREIQRRWDDLSKRDTAFDKQLQAMLDGAQRKRYQKWRDEEKKAAEAARRGERHRGFGAGAG